jgi:hypothetical protein
VDPPGPSGRRAVGPGSPSRSRSAGEWIVAIEILADPARLEQLDVTIIES